MKNILVPIDFSECSLNAAEAAAQLAREHNGKVHFAYFIEILVVYGEFPTQMNVEQFNIESYKEYYNAKFGGLKLAEWNHGFEAHYHAEIQNVSQGILDKAEDLGCDLIVMGTTGATGMKEYVIGSNTAKVVRLSEIPVIAVKQPVKDFGIKDVLFVSNFYGEVEQTFKDEIIPFLSPFDPTYHMLKVITPSNFEPSYRTLKVMDDFVEITGLNKFTVNIYNDDSIEDGIKNFMDLTNYDMVVMPTHGKSVFAQLLNRSETEKVINHVDVNLLSLHINEPAYEPGPVFYK